MKVPIHLKPGEVGFNMTPMIDVVFLLIIFFLVSSHLAKQEAQMELPLPVAESAEADIENNRRLTLNVNARGELLLAGRRIQPDQLKARLVAAKNSSEEDLEVRVRGDRNVPYRHIEPVMLSCARAGVWKVTFGVFRPEEDR